SRDEFLDELLSALDGRWRVVSYFGAPEGVFLRLYCLFSSKADATLGVMSTVVTTGCFPSLVEYVPQLHLFEREIAEQYGIEFEGHPWMKPVRFQEPFGAPPGQALRSPGKIGIMDFYQVEGSEVHEVAVGPVHAGIIEPGHFRFQCFGEQVLHLEISLGYQHRGVERALVGGPGKRTIHYMETLAGDTSVGHTTAYCH